MQGSRIIVRDFEGKPRLARLYKDRGEIVDVVGDCVHTSEENSDLTIPAIGFRRVDVFRYNSELMITADWAKAEPV